ncbi:hypothetical protein BJ165DRAFT_1511348 [Panaeolus papilionaceus]|nr:hypothetical protein BJ165DRAFT_1511348 [Panaeolus papilionaceus]
MRKTWAESNGRAAGVLVAYVAMSSGPSSLGNVDDGYPPGVPYNFYPRLLFSPTSAWLLYLLCLQLWFKHAPVSQHPTRWLLHWPTPIILPSTANLRSCTRSSVSTGYYCPSSVPN